MSSLIVIHGTGVREDAYKNTLKVVGSKLYLARDSTKAVSCYWGAVGANLPEKPLCLPPGSDRAVTGLVESDITIEGWEALYENPYGELQAFRASDVGASRSEVAELSDHIRSVAPSENLKASLTKVLPVAAWEEARKSVVGRENFDRALDSAGSNSGSLRAVVARAIVAKMTQDALTEGRPVPADELRDQWVALTYDLLRPSGEPVSGMDSRGLAEIKSKLGGVLGWGGQWLAAGFAERKRMAEAATIAPVVGDIILYQSPRGENIRREIRNAIQNAPKPRYVLAHSLGSVAAVDTLVLQEDSEVDHLFTIGSPAPLFYELNALVSRERGEALPEHFPKWTNIYDPKDLISYVAKATFKGDDRINDEVHLSGQPLLAAHSAYWASDKAWAYLWKVIPCKP